MCIRDRGRGSVGSLSTSQFIAIFTLIAGIILVIVSQMLANKGVKAFRVGPGGTAWQAEPESTKAGEAASAAENKTDDEHPESDNTSEPEKEDAPEDAAEDSGKE